MQVKIDPEIEKFIYSLEEQTIAKALQLRTRGKQEIRIFYTFHKKQAVLLHGFIKKKQKTPVKELNTALQRLTKLKTN